MPAIDVERLPRDVRLYVRQLEQEREEALDACAEVVKNWTGGDLAGAVNDCRLLVLDLEPELLDDFEDETGAFTDPDE
jgi:hypothetical protein